MKDSFNLKKSNNNDFGFHDDLKTCENSSFANGSVLKKLTSHNMPVKICIDQVNQVPWTNNHMCVFMTTVFFS